MPLHPLIRVTGSQSDADHPVVNDQLGFHWTQRVGPTSGSILGHENPSNRNTQRVFTSLHFYDLLAKDLDLTLEENYVRARLDGQTTHTAQFEGGSEQVTKDCERDETLSCFAAKLNTASARSSRHPWGARTVTTTSVRRWRAALFSERTLSSMDSRRYCQVGAVGDNR